MLSYAITQGRVIAEPCEYCGARQGEGHHEIYAVEYALVVVWLCKQCHSRRHNRDPPVMEFVKERFKQLVAELPDQLDMFKDQSERPGREPQAKDHG